MLGPLNRKPGSPDPRLSGPTRRAAVGLILGAPLLAACSGSQVSSPFGPSAPEGAAGQQQQPDERRAADGTVEQLRQSLRLVALTAAASPSIPLR